MKTIPLILASLSFSPQGWSQFIEVTDQRTPFTEYGRMFPLGENWAFVYGHNGFCVRNDAGNTVSIIQTPMSISFEPGAESFGGDVITLPDGGAILVGPEDGCDFLGGSFLWRLDENAQLVWETELWSNFYGYALLARSPFEQIAAIGYHEVMITDLAGSVNTTWSIPHDNIRVALWEDPDLLLLGSGDAILRYNADGLTLDSIHLGQEVSDLRLSGSGLLALAADSLYVLDGGLNVGSTYGMPEASFAAREFIQGSADVLVRCDSAIVGWNALDGATVVFLPELLHGQRIHDVFLSNEQFITASTVDENDRLSGLMRTYGPDGSTSSHDEDVSITMTVDTAWFEPIGGWAPSNYFYRRANVTIDVTVVGASTVHDLVISHESSPYFTYSCEPEVSMIRLHGAQLEPGTDTTLTMEGLYIWWGASAPGGVGTSEVCVVAQSPNYKVDRYPEDNRSCQEITVVNTVGIEDHDAFATPTAFPNPFTDHVLLSSTTTGLLNITLLDGTGREVFTSQIAASSGPTRIDLPELRDGIYLLRTFDDDHQWTQRLVKGTD